MTAITPQPTRILYRNHAGKIAVRRILPLTICFNSTEWHPEPQWLLVAKDLDKQAERTFALRDVLAWDVWPAEVPAEEKTR